jgi:hypothetical protein
MEDQPMEDATNNFVASVKLGLKDGKHISQTPNMGTKENVQRVTPSEKSASNF